MKKSTDKGFIGDLLAGSSTQIPVSIELEQCLEDFFRCYSTIIEKNNFYRNAEKKLNFLLMKRFVFTAYNNLVEMDQSISKGKVSKPYRLLISIRKKYDELTQYVSKPVTVAFDQLFLSRQANYIEVLEYLEYAKNRIDAANASLRGIQSKITSAKERLSIISSNNPEFEELNSELKKYNGMYVDTLQDISDKKTEVNILSAVKDAFSSENLESFKNAFTATSAEKIGALIDILDALTHELDMLLWEEARESIIIRKFFKIASIEGSFSSKTYLKYFIRNLKKESVGSEYEQLIELYNYLEGISNKNILIVTTDTDRSEEDKKQIEQIDKDYTVMTATNPDKIPIEHKKMGLHLVIIDFEQRYGDGVDYVSKFWELFPTAKRCVQILMRFQNPTYESLNKAGKSGIKHMMIHSNDPSKMIDKLRQVI